MKTVRRILEDIEIMRREFGVTHFDFVHDMFTVRRDTVEEICAALNGSGITWNCSARTDRLTEDLLETMVGAGCTGIYVGIETGSQRLQALTRKNLRVEDAIKTIRLCQSKGVNVTASLIAGYPQESMTDLLDTLLCYLELLTPHPSPHARGTVTPQIHLFAPLAETPILSEAPSYRFDGRLSATIRIDYADGLWPEEFGLIAADFDLFSAFYHPVPTEYGRNDYLGLDALIEVMPRFPEIAISLARNHRLSFANYLLAGGFLRSFEADSCWGERILAGFVNPSSLTNLRVPTHLIPHGGVSVH